MVVQIKNRCYRMGQKEYQGLLQIASEQVLFGIYAVEKRDTQSCAVTGAAAWHS